MDKEKIQQFIDEMKALELAVHNMTMFLVGMTVFGFIGFVFLVLCFSVPGEINKLAMLGIGCLSLLASWLCSNRNSEASERCHKHIKTATTLAEELQL